MKEEYKKLKKAVLEYIFLSAFFIMIIVVLTVIIVFIKNMWVK